MGEYVKLDGKGYKLGTCEDLYYVRYEQLAGWIKERRVEETIGNLPPREYMGGAFRFRFPFPNEDHCRDFNGPEVDFDYGLGVSLPDDLDFDIEHDRISTNIKAKSGDYGINASLPCPQSKDWAALPKEINSCVGQTWTGRTSYIEIVQQRPFEGSLWTVIRCAHCGARIRLNVENGTLLACYLRGRHCDTYPGQASFWTEVANRIEAGYQTALVTA